MKVLLDTNILLDYFLKRIPFEEDAKRIIDFCGANIICGFIAAHSIPNLFYIMRKKYSYDELKQIILNLTIILSITDLSKDRIMSALANDNFCDFEDCF